MTRLAEFWVAVSFVAFLLIVLYYKVPQLIAKMLDERADGIRKEIDEARRLREDAQKLLADYQQKHRSAGQEAEAIVEEARREAEAFAQIERAKSAGGWLDISSIPGKGTSIILSIPLAEGPKIHNEEQFQ